MSERISIAALRLLAEHGSGEIILALLEAVEAAREASGWLNSHDDGPGAAEAKRRLDRALARFDFGDA